ncbi:MAG TPA: Sir2 family NAD-dependent protein deacetylase [Thermotogota bacterium]|nr:Sir2 family NAD-dependent protein deacetylase [Thermotogota bacterium]
MNPERKTLFRAILQAQHLVVLTGAGVSTDSGIPDFRGENGLYSRWDPYEVFDITAFRRDPSTFFQFSRQELFSMTDREPNNTHRLLAQLEKRGILKALATQNIDTLHHKAGSKNVLELHGSLRTGSCLVCGHRITLDEMIRLVANNPAPGCPLCGGIFKPDIVFFGEGLPPSTWQSSLEHCKQSDVFLAVGTSLSVHPAASLPIVACQNGAKLIIVNRGETSLDTLAWKKWDGPLKEWSESFLEFLEERNECKEKKEAQPPLLGGVDGI